MTIVVFKLHILAMIEREIVTALPVTCMLVSGNGNSLVGFGSFFSVSIVKASIGFT